MEEFIDLSRYCRMDKLDGLLTKDVDELNTPIFELRNPFDFSGQLRTINNHTDFLQKQEQQQHIDHNYINIKNETENVNNNNDLFNNRCANANFPRNIKVEDMIDTIENSLDFSTIINTNNNNNNDNKETVLLQAEEDLIDSMNPNTMAYTILVDDDEDKLVIVDKFDDVLNIKKVPESNVDQRESSPQPLQRYHRLSTYDTPDESTCSSITSSRSTMKNQNLRLDIAAASNYIDETSSMKTSDIVDTITDIESGKPFNILQYIDEEELKLATETADSLPTTTASTGDDVEENTISLEDLELLSASTKRSTRKRYKEESDEEYLPPAKKCSRNKYRSYEDDDDDDDESQESFRTKRSKRGRPPKRNVSISSLEDYQHGDTPETRYRELRDKNNEASRKSRLKRKVKERELEVESDELEQRNQKLRVQVEELERIVTSFRSNLMTLLLNKK